MQTNETNSKFLPAAVIIAGLFIAGAVYWNGSHPVAAPAGTAPTPAGAVAVDIKNVKTDRNPFIGQANAPITIAAWSDFKCQYCKNFEVQTLPQIIKEYVDTGKVKIVFMDFAFLGNNSVTIALYGRSVWKLYPNQYFAWRTAVFAAQDQEGNQGFGDTASVDKLNATITGIDAVKIAADVKANMSAYQAMLDADKAEASKVGINATPSFVIGKQVIAGAYPYANFKAAIDELLK